MIVFAHISHYFDTILDKERQKKTLLRRILGQINRHMKKTYVEKITSWVTDNKSKRSKSLASFLAQKSDINEALDEGFSTYLIWKHQVYEGNISMSYRQFCRYVYKHIGKTEKIIKARKNKKDEKPKTTFTFNPVPNEEDLY